MSANLISIGSIDKRRPKNEITANGTHGVIKKIVYKIKDSIFKGIPHVQTEYVQPFHLEICRKCDYE